MNKKEVASELNLTAIRNIPEINPGDDLSQIINGCLTHQNISLKDKDVLIIAQKIISKSENRFIDLKTVDPSEKAKEVSKKTDKDPRLVELILQESCEIIRAEKGILVVEHKLGHILANAGIDRSNTARPDNEVLLLPIDPDKSARKIKQYFEDLYQIKIGVLITDSIGRAWRLGTTGHALGSSGLKTLIDLRNNEFDRDGRLLQTTIIGVADQIASASTLLMGESSEGTPAVIMRGLDLCDYSDTVKNLIRPVEEDLFR
jgi:coenzyme F420-0:L-glutamate ligase/coenzyme F420-1:gamma-L-glutamate ligase